MAITRASQARDVSSILIARSEKRIPLISIDLLLILNYIINIFVFKRCLMKGLFGALVVHTIIALAIIVFIVKLTS